MDKVFNQQQTDSLFLYHLKINLAGEIVDCGKSILNICSTAIDNLFINQFEIENHTTGPIIDYLLQHLHEKIVIQTKGGNIIHLTGQFVMNEQSNLIVFMGSPSFSSIKEIKEAKGNNYEKNLLFEFKVTDTGIGISPEKLANKFDEIFQASSETSRKYGGTGLGLTITKNLIEMQGGTIKAESIVNKGTKFIVRIPYQKRILVAEDVTINQIIVKQILEE